MKPFKRYCKTLQLAEDDGTIGEYKRYHAPGSVWPEISEGLRSVGVRDMEIYISGSTLFMIMDIDADVDHDTAMERLAGLPRQAEWEALMSRYQFTDPSSSAKEKWRLMDRIYTLNP